AAAILLLLLLPLPCSEVAVTVVNWLVTAILPPRLLAKLALKDGIPAEYRTLVAVPTLIRDAEGVRRLLSDLEVRALGNPDEHLHFALVTDFPDADAAELPGEAELLELARGGIAELNRRHAGTGRFLLLHRRRVWNPAQGR